MYTRLTGEVKGIEHETEGEAGIVPAEDDDEEEEEDADEDTKTEGGVNPTSTSEVL